jgi:hypothetical protein
VQRLSGFWIAVLVIVAAAAALIGGGALSDSSVAVHEPSLVSTSDAWLKRDHPPRSADA